MNDNFLYNITIRAGEDYMIDFYLMDGDEQDTIDMSGWIVEATLREFAESIDGIDFVCLSDSEGIHLRMSRTLTERIGFSYGVYDVFIVDPDNNIRIKYVGGQAYIIAESTR